MNKLKFGFYWAASCGGCEIAVLDVAEVLFWSVAMDIKYKDVEAGDITTFSEECTPPVEAANRRVVEDIISLAG